MGKPAGSVYKPRLTDLPPHPGDDLRPPRIMHRTAVLLGGKMQLARLCNVQASTVSNWMHLGYSVDSVCRMYFALGEHIKELQEHHKEVELALMGKIKKKGYRFPGDLVFVKQPDGRVG